mgnify:CR=1 FL=1
MNEKFPEYKGLDLSEVNKEILKTWEENKTFEMSLKTREGHPHSFSMKVLLQRTACPESIM